MSSFQQQRTVRATNAPLTTVKVQGTNVTRATKGMTDAKSRLMGASSLRGNTKEITGLRLNNSQLKAAPTVRQITDQELHAMEHRKEEMLKLQAFLKKGFEQQAQGLLLSIRQSQEQIGKDLSDKFTSVQASMALLNKNILAADENQRNNFKQLQHRIIETETKVNEYREKIKELFKELNTNDEARFRQTKLKLEEYNALIKDLTRDLDEKIKDMELKINGALNGLMDKLHNIDMALNAGFDAARAQLNLELAKIKDALLRETDPAKLRELERQAEGLNKENEDVEIYVCLICGSTLHGANCAAYSDTSVRRSYKIKRRQLKKLQAITAVGINNAYGEDAYFVQVGSGGDIAERFEQLIRAAGIAV
jgi:hypothetical protein